MIIPVKCFTCGMVIANKYRYYVEQVRKKKLAKRGNGESIDVAKVLYLTKEFVDKAHSFGKSVYAYRVNEKELADKLIAMGVDDIGTDFPKLFIKE